VINRKFAGACAILGGLMAIGLTLPFAAAYFIAYPGYELPPFWYYPVLRLLQPALGFGEAIEVYNTYGRIYNLVYVLFLPATLALHALHRGVHSRLEGWGFWLTVVGLIASLIGVAGDYWANGAGFILELLGLLVLVAGCVLTGMAAWRSKLLPEWSAALLMACLPGYVIWFRLIGHIPSGPTFGVALAYLGVGIVLLSGKQE